MPYYPGSSYVDWIGTDAYPKNTWLTLQQLATTSGGSSGFDWYDTFKSYGKPLMFGEVGIMPANLYGNGAPTRATWWQRRLQRAEESATRREGHRVLRFQYRPRLDVRRARDAPW